MLVLFETAKGYAIFKLHDEKKLERVDKLAKVFQKSESKLNKVISLHHFERFESTADAVKCAVSIQDAKLGKILKKTIKKSIIKQELTDEIAVADHKLGSQISKKFNINCQSSAVIQELMYLIRSRADDLIPKLEEDDDKVMQLGVSHGIGRYKIKFSPEKVDIMIIQAVSLLDELDKELNNYIMRCREWYGWHFPELSKIIPPPNHLTYVKVILAMGMRTSANDVDLSELIEDEETIVKVKEYAEISMGTDITDEDLENIKSLCENIVELCEYRTQLFEYLRNRMMTIAPNLTVLVGELVGARLISHAGSLMNLAKHPASTVQILGAEKALFRALKTKHDTPKYGLIYHAQLVGQSSAAMKGKMSRCLAAKASLAIRSDAFGENPSCEMAMEHRAKLEAKLQVLEQTSKPKMNGSGKKRAKPYENVEHRSKKVKLES